MADENTPAFYPRVGQNIAKNFRSVQPPAFVEDPRAMDLPQYGDVDLSVPTQANLEMGRRMAQRQADLKRQQERDRSPLEKVAGALQTGRFLGSALTQAINSLPTRLVHGDKAAEKFMEERMYKPTQPTAYEYAGDIGDFLGSLETDYKIPPILPEAMALQYLTGPATAQAARATGRGVEQAGRKLESAMEPVVKGALERGGLPREMVMAMGANTQSNVIKPKGGNWIGGDVENALKSLKRGEAATPQEVAESRAYLDRARATWDPENQRQVDRMEREFELLRANDALNRWVDSNLTNYVKKDMGTPDDPVRKLAEQDISHLPQDLQNVEMTWTPEELAKTRKRFGFPEEETATNPTAKMWEQMADEMIAPSRATEFGEKARQQNPWLEKLNPYDTVYETMRGMPQALGFNHIVDVLREDLTTGRIRPEQLNKVSMEQAVRRTFEYDQELAKKMNDARMTSRAELPVYKEYPEGLKWVELNRPGDFAAESDAMGHSVRGYEPPKGSDDWTEGSGDSGYGGYGLGGWNAIKSGKAKVYSLIDSKGEPHVTVEVGANHPQWSKVENAFGKEKASELFTEFKTINPNYGGQSSTKIADIFNEFLTTKGLEPIDYGFDIVQIKGKQNAKPKDDYIPFVQDFVKSGNWSVVGDFKNTGLRRIEDVPERARFESAGMKLPKYVTEADHENLINEYMRLTGTPRDPVFMNKEYGFPLPDGMKRGGKVSISNNPDTMMMELGNQKMKNGVPAYGVAGAVIKQGLKAAKPEAMKASEALGKIEGRPLKITQSDRTKVGEGYLGGPGFSGLQLTEPEYRAAEAAWGVQNAGTAKTILGGGKKGDNAVYAAMIGTPTQHQSNQMVFDKLYGDFKKAAKRGELTPELRDLINTRLAASVDKKGNPVFPADVDILDKNFRNIADTFSRRSIAGNLMGGVQVGGKKGQIIDYDKIIRNTTDPALLDLPTGALGNRLFTLSGGIVDRPDLHPAFPAILQGEDLGLTFTPVERNLVMKDFVDKTMREKKRMPGYMDYTRGNPPTQLITEDILTELQKLGLKKGGAVKQPAAYIDGSEFVEAAQKYGIRDSMSNLNMIVNLVNKGLSVDDAARQVSDSGMHKAVGGEVSGDDLILEERPL